MRNIYKKLRDAAATLLEHIPSHGPGCQTEKGCEVYEDPDDDDYCSGGPMWNMRETIRLFDEAVRHACFPCGMQFDSDHDLATHVHGAHQGGNR